MAGPQRALTLRSKGQVTGLWSVLPVWLYMLWLHMYV